MRTRWAPFLVVGLGGFVVQIAAVGLLAGAGVPDALATAIAVELAILHNFYWHVRWTWRDRSAGVIRELLRQLLRFNVSAGLVSLPGNVLLSVLLVSHARLPLAFANVIAVGLLSTLNFVLADRWAFTR